MNKIFVYGTLKSPKIQKELFGKELKMYEAILKDYSIYEAEDGWYFIDKKIGNVVNGYVIELDDSCLEICDAFEPSSYTELLLRQRLMLKITLILLEI